MTITSDDIAPIIGAATAGLATLVTVITNLVMTIRQGRVQRQHGEDIKGLQATTGTFKALGSKPPDGV